jgi:hypothetical protein
MKAKVQNKETLDKALEIINKKYEGNVIYNRLPERKGNFYHFTLRVKSSHNLGHRIGFHPTSTGKNRRLVSACWHVHGDYFEAIFSIEPSAIIDVSTHRITKSFGNWQDRNIGSMMIPMYFSEACECE